jgi:hypothetical protein
MKKYLLALICAAIANTAWAQSPVACAEPCPQRCGPVCAPKCPTCVEQFKTICVPTATVKIKTTICYTSTCEKICYPKCTFSGFGFGCKTCDSCEQGNCGSHIYTKRYLVKTVATEEIPITKCVPVTVPACDAQRFLHPASLVTPVQPTTPAAK